MPDIYVSVDIEADGPIPGPYSMLSIGAAAFQMRDTIEQCRQPVATFEMNLEPLPGAAQHPDTMEWWGKQDPKVWEYVTCNPKPPQDVMQAFKGWVQALPGKPVMLTYPTWDYMWVHWYLINYCGRPSPLGFDALDMKSYAYAALDAMGGLGRRKFRSVSKSRMPRWMKEGCPPHTHKALDDATEQGIQMMNLMFKFREL